MLAATLTLLLGIIVILVIIVANGFFVAQEFAYMSVDRQRLAALADKGDVAARRALAVTRRTSFMLSGAQLGITVTGLLVGYVAEPLVGESLGVLLGGAGVPPAVSITVGTVLALVFATIVQMIFGELYPKNLAIASPEPLARALALPTRIYLTLFGWLIRIFDLAANGFLRLLRIEPLEDVDSSATSRDLEYIVEDSRASGDLRAELSLMIDRIIDFPQRDVEHAMIPRSRVDAVRADTSVTELRELMSRAHTRYPVVDERDAPIGVVQMIDVLAHPEATDAEASALMRDALILPATMPLPEALSRLRASGGELACVVDEYGSFDGILTVEDLTEEVVGELTDEHDVAQDVATRDADGAWRVAGDVHIDEIERLISADLPRGDYETIAGLAIAEHGDLPQPGTVTTVDLLADRASVLDKDVHARTLHIEVLEVDRHVPSLLRLCIEEHEEPEEHDAARRGDETTEGAR